MNIFKRKKPGELKPGNFKLNNQAVAYIVTIQYANWRKSYPDARRVLERGLGNVFIRTHYENLCNTYGKKLVDNIFKDLYDINIGYAFS